MLGTFQQSNLRIELDASAQRIQDSLLCPAQFRRWLFPQTFSDNLPDRLSTGVTFTGWFGPIPVQHQVESTTANHLRFILSQGVDGYHEWYWGEGWVQSCLAGISVLPLNLGQTATLLRLRRFLSLEAAFQRK